jgi:serine phosphatase RsbU (regulator of sigma subunit)
MMGSKYKILIVDDEPYNLDYLEQELEDLGHDLFPCENGIEALALIDSEKPDLVLLDIMMPGVDGFEVLSRMKAKMESRDIPVIIISAANSLESVVQGIKLGADDYLPKPFEPTLLKARITSTLEKKHLRDIEQLYLNTLQREMNIAREIQKGFLPSSLPKKTGWEIGVFFRAAKQVAGDFYDVFSLSDGNLLCVIGDVCDKGVGAALFMTLFRSLIRVTCVSDAFSENEGDISISPELRLKRAINFTNNYVAQVHEEANMFATIFIAILDPTDGCLTYINCGNEPPILFRQKEKTQLFLTPTGPAVGLIPNAVFSVNQIQMQQQDQLVAFTDGIPDLIDTTNQPYGIEPLMKLISEASDSPNSLCERIEKDIDHFIIGIDQFDDISLMAIRRT